MLFSTCKWVGQQLNGVKAEEMRVVFFFFIPAVAAGAQREARTLTLFEHFEINQYFRDFREESSFCERNA